MAPEGMRNKVGSPARGPDFLAREKEERELWDLLDRDHVLMLAPRRVGKTSLMWYLHDQPREDWRCLYLLVEDLSSEAQFIAEFLHKAWDANPNSVWLSRLGHKLTSILQSFEHVDAGPVKVQLTRAVDEAWQEVADTLLRVLGLLPGRTLILIDEFPIFVRRLLGRDQVHQERTRHFLNWFRAARQTLELNSGRLRFLLTGSIGLDAVVHTVRMSSTINDLARYRLGPLTPELADQLLVRLAEGEQIELGSEVRAHMLDRISWHIPFHLQLLFSQVRRRQVLGSQQPAHVLVGEAYQALLAADQTGHFNHWVERLDDDLRPLEEQRLKLALLEAAARDQKGISRGTILQLRRQHAPRLNPNSVLHSLAHDGYLVEHEDRWRFASALLRDWWLKWKSQGR